MMSAPHDSPISRLDRVGSSISGDLLLISQLSDDLSSYHSASIEHNDFVGSVISSMGSDLSSVVQRELSDVLGGTVTLVTWK